MLKTIFIVLGLGMICFAGIARAEPVVVVRTDPAGVEIISINNDDDFAVLSAGTDRGLKEGDVLEVQRDGKKITVLKVMELRREIAAAVTVPAGDIDKLTEGDKVILPAEKKK